MLKRTMIATLVALALALPSFVVGSLPAFTQVGGGVTSPAPTLTTIVGTLGADKGGTGQTSYAVGDMLYASASTTISKLAGVATGNALISGGVTTAPSWGKIGLTTHISGTLDPANGGTGVANNAAATLTRSGNHALTITTTGTTGVTLPTTGTLATTTNLASYLPLAGGTMLGTIVTSGAPASGPTLNGDAATLSVTQGSNAALPSFSGLVIVSNPDDGSTSTWVMGGGVAVMLGTSTATWVASTSSPGAGKLSIAFASSAYRIYNNYGSTQAIKVMFLASRSGV